MHTFTPPKKSLNKAFLKLKPDRRLMDSFKNNLQTLLGHINEQELEEYHKNLVGTFLKRTYYEPDYFINTKGRNDMVIHNGKDGKSNVGVIIEAKKPANRSEMMRKDAINTKAFQELVLYYMRERITHNNTDLRHLIATNIYEWFVFDAQLFEKIFAGNKVFVKEYVDFTEGRKAGATTDFFYKNIAEPFIESVLHHINFTWFDLRDYQKILKREDKVEDTKLIPLVKVFSPQHLFKLPFANDSNSLNQTFYKELLHIIGLVESKEKNKKLIGRAGKQDRLPGTLLENAINQIDSLDKVSRLNNPSRYGKNHEERLFNLAMELCITWMNRILFLKLMEGQLMSYHKGDKSYKFLGFDRIHNFDDLNTLFFSVLAKTPADRIERVRESFSKVPFLNSSLFEPEEMEHQVLFLSQLNDDLTLPIHPQTVLKDSNGKRLKGELNTLEYLFRFLDAYDFSSEGGEEIQEESKTLINASVLGLIFEKINGYKDGSIFTPGFITMYMSKATLEKAVVQKFNEAKGWNCKTFADLQEDLNHFIRNHPEGREAARMEANVIVNSLRIIDPAVGSGHFLVSCLNELIAIKYRLNILQDRNGRSISGYTVEVVNDELAISRTVLDDEPLFRYIPGDQESQRVQEALFHEKQVLIENCLFGVDINPNSVKICRLRLWIELLKNAYYKAETHYTELETLPNIDINIKCGNSLISRFSLDADLKKVLKTSNWSVESYRIAVSAYRNARTKDEKRAMEKLILKIKQDCSTEFRINDPIKKRLDKLGNELYHRFSGTFLFEPETPYGKSEKKLQKQREKEEADLRKEISTLTRKFEENKNNKILEASFEWRFEFPEVLNENGDFIGFDLVIGNPPYIRQEELSEIKEYLSQKYHETFTGTADLYVYFVELGMRLLKPGGDFVFIIPNKWMRASYGKKLRNFIKDNSVQQIIDFGDLPVFDEATTYPCIIELKKGKPVKKFSAVNVDNLDFPNGIELYLAENRIEILSEELSEEGWTLTDARVQKLLAKIRRKGVPLGEYVSGKIYRGLLTGLNEAFVVDAQTRDSLIADDPSSQEIIKPFLAGRDIKRYQQPVSDKYLILFKNGDTSKWFGKQEEKAAFSKMKSKYPAIMEYLQQFEERAKARHDKGNYWWELRACDYYEEFEKDKIMLPDIALRAECLLDLQKAYSVNTAYIIPTNDKFLLGLLNSKLVHFFYSNMTSSIRGGYMRFIRQYIEQIPVVVDHNSLKDRIIELVDTIQGQVKNNPQYNISEIDYEIDRLVFELYGLTEEEIAIIEGTDN